MQTARNLVARTTEFTACVKYCENNGYGRKSCFFVDTGRNTTAVITNCDDIARQNLGFNMSTIACKSLVDRVVHGLVNEMVETLLAYVSDIHCRAFSYSLQTLQNLDVAG